MKLHYFARSAAAVATLALGAATLVAAPAQANPANTDLVITEAYTNAGSANAVYTNKFIELYNPTGSPISLAGWSLQYRSATGTGAFTKYDLSGSVAAGKYFLIQGGSNGANGEALPTPDATVGINTSGTTGTVALVHSTTALPATVTGNVVGSPSTGNAIVDLLGYGGSNTFETALAAAPSSNSDAKSMNRTGSIDTDNNAPDFSLSATVTPCNSAGCPAGPPPPDPPVEKTIEEIQGNGTDSPFKNVDVTTRGVVTAVYETGGFSGAYIQTEGTGGPVDFNAHDTSSGVFVFASAFADAVDRGDFVEVTGTVKEFNGLTEISTKAGDFTILSVAHGPVTPSAVSFPLSDVRRESLEGMLLDVGGDYTITNNFATNQYGEIGLADGDEPLQTPTNVVAPGALAIALQAENDQRLITLDDGSSTNYLTSGKDTAVPWLTPDNEVRAGAPVTFVDPVILDFRFGWKLQPTQQLLAGGDEPVSIGNTRTAAPEPVGGGVKIGTFNVLNYFTTTAVDFVAMGGGRTCTTYADREGNPITANRCNPDGPRGAANDANLARQQAKIVEAINTLDADVVSLEEIENSIKYTNDRDEALSILTAALNEAAGEDRWAFVPSPATGVPANEDVIRTAFIYQKAVVETVDDSEIFDSSAFVNARQPLAQAFRPVVGAASSTFAVIVNHFKSKGSGSGIDADQGDGQGASNNSRKLQAADLVDFAADFAGRKGTDRVFLTGDFNAYNEEDPIKIIEDADYVNVARELTDKETYQFGGQIGSLDHVFASAGAFDRVTGADIWNINSYESVAREYSRFNYNLTNLYQATPYRASDHDPELVGFNAADAEAVASTVEASVPASEYGEKPQVSVEVTAEGDIMPTGEVTVTEVGSDDVLGTATLTSGRATVELEALALEPGDHQLTVNYAGDEQVAPSSTTVTATVNRADSAVDVTSWTPGTVGRDKQPPILGVSVRADGFTIDDGAVLVFEGSRLVGSGAVRDGSVDVSLPGFNGAGRKTLTVVYSGGNFAEASSTTYRTPPGR